MLIKKLKEEIENILDGKTPTISDYIDSKKDEELLKKSGIDIKKQKKLYKKRKKLISKMQRY